MKYLPYGRQWVDETDIEAVVEVLRSDWLTTGPMVERFEQAFTGEVDAQHAVAVSSGTAGLHAAMYSLRIGPGDEVIVPAMTFAATANCVVYQGARPVFCDVDPFTLLLDPYQVEGKISSHTKAIICVDYAGQPCDYNRLRAISERLKIALVADSCHSLGATYQKRRVGGIADLTIFSFHPVKHITTGEGGMVTTNSAELAERLRVFRNHGITTNHRQRSESGAWFYEMVDLGYNYRISDIQCALGLSQLGKLQAWVRRRQEIAALYDQAFRGEAGVAPLKCREDVTHAYHLYVVQITSEGNKRTRDALFSYLRSQGIGINVHYIPVHLHPYYRKTLGTEPGLCPAAESAYERIISLPMFPRMSNDEVDRVIRVVSNAMDSAH